jgi:branched-chain amino acid transport system ATP-binding protein
MLELSDVTTTYGGIVAVRDVTLKVQAGATVALVGSNGAGKTTLLHTICGICRPAAGEITLRGESITGAPAHRIARKGILLVPEGRQILGPLSVRENLELGRLALGGRPPGADATLSAVYALFPILAERENQTAGSLSGGEQQMLAIGRALMGRPEILLLDEPSLGLAPKLVTSVFEALARLNRAGLTILLVEQNARRALEIASYAYVMERGRIVAEGASERLRSDTNIQAHYLGGVALEVSARELPPSNAQSSIHEHRGRTG